MVNEPDDLYAELGVSENATAKDINEAWRLRVSIWHPDKHAAARQQVQDLAKETTTRLNRAKDILSDPEQRRRYDAKRKERQTPRREDADQRERAAEEAAKPDSQRASDETQRQERRRHTGTKRRPRQERDVPKASKRTSPPRGADGRWKRSEGSTGRSRKPGPREPHTTTTTPSGEIFGTVVVYGFGLGAAAAGVWLVLQIPGAIQVAFSAVPKAWLLGIVALALLALWSPRLVLGLALFAAWCWA